MSQSNQLFKNIAEVVSLGKLYDNSGSVYKSKSVDERIRFHEKTKFLKSLNISSKTSISCG